jgi:hypothetical protein
MLELLCFKAAAVQSSPVFLDTGAAAFIPGYPYWNWIADQGRGS